MALRLRQVQTLFDEIFDDFFARFAKALAETVEREIDDRGGKQRQHLADNQTADDADAERMAQFGTDAGAQHQRQCAQQAAIVVIKIGRKRNRQA